MPRFVCDRCRFEETRPADQEPWICPSCGWARWSNEKGDDGRRSPAVGSPGRAHGAGGSGVGAGEGPPGVEVEPLEIHREFEGVRLEEPGGVAVGPAGEVVIVDSGNQRIIRLDGDEVLTTGLEGELPDGARPLAAAFDPRGKIRVATNCSRAGAYREDSERILVLDRELEVLGSFGERAVPMPPGNLGPGPMGTFNHPVAVAVAGDGRTYVAEATGGRVQVFAPVEIEDGTVRTEVVNWWGEYDIDLDLVRTGTEPGVWSDISDMTLEGDEVVVLDGFAPCAHVFDLEGEPRGLWRLADDDLTSFSTLAFLPSGHLVVIEKDRNRMHVRDPRKGVVAVSGGPGMKPGQFLSPEGMAAGDDGIVYVADTGNHRVQVLRVEA